MINKKKTDELKDKQFASDVNTEQIRTVYEQTKAENIKLKDNLDTQNKLWKIWLLKNEDVYSITDSIEDDIKAGNKNVTDEVIEVDDEIANEDNENEEDIPAIIFKKCMEYKIFSNTIS